MLIENYYNNSIVPLYPFMHKRNLSSNSLSQQSIPNLSAFGNRSNRAVRYACVYPINGSGGGRTWGRKGEMIEFPIQPRVLFPPRAASAHAAPRADEGEASSAAATTVEIVSFVVFLWLLVVSYIIEQFIYRNIAAGDMWHAF